MRQLVWIIVALLLAVAIGCGGADEAAQEAGPPSDWPEELITGDGTGPALYLHDGPDSPAVGYLSRGVPVRIAGAPQGDRVPVRISGPLKVRGWLSLSRLAARVTERGKIADTPVYVGPNDIVGIRGSAGEGLLRVEARPYLGRANAPALGSFVGSYPAARLTAETVDFSAADGPTPGEPHLLPAGQEVAVYERPGGEVVATLPALDPPLTVVVLRDRGEWKGIRAGVGPYLIGYVNAELTPTDAAPTAPEEPGASPAGTVPQRLSAEGERPIWRVAEGTRIRFDGRTIAIFGADGFAREMNRYDTGEVDVFVAINDDIAIRGMVQADDLLEWEDTAAPEPEPEPEPTDPEPATEEPTEQPLSAPTMPDATPVPGPPPSEGDDSADEGEGVVPMDQ